MRSRTYDGKSCRLPVSSTLVPAVSSIPHAIVDIAPRIQSNEILVPELVALSHWSSVEMAGQYCEKEMERKYTVTQNERKRDETLTNGDEGTAKKVGRQDIERCERRGCVRWTYRRDVSEVI